MEFISLCQMTEVGLYETVTFLCGNVANSQQHRFVMKKKYIMSFTVLYVCVHVCRYVSGGNCWSDELPAAD